MSFFKKVKKHGRNRNIVIEDEDEMLAEIGGKKARVENFSGIQVLSPPVS